MNGTESKPAVAVYLRHYLSPSETFVYRQLQGVRSGFAPIVLTANPYNLDRFPTGPLYVARKGLAGKVYGRLAQAASGHYARLTPLQTGVYREAVQRHHVRMIHAHFAHFALDVLPLAVEQELPMLVTFHGMDASTMLGNTRYMRDVGRLVDYATVIVVSQNMLERLAAAGIHPRDPHVHYIGVPVEEFTFVKRRSVAKKIEKHEEVRFLQVGNFVEVKGHVYTIEAFARFASEYPRARLILAGDGPLRKLTVDLCRKHRIAERVEFPGTVDKPEVIRLMREADVFLQHSVTLEDGCMEGLPTVLMEAMATGLVVVSTRHSGIPELVDDGVSGFLVSERDVDGYTERLLSLRSLDDDVGKRARATVESRFNMSIQNERLIELYRRVIARAL